MLLWLFGLFVGLGLILIIMGYAFDVVLMDLTGMIMLFLIGISLLGTGLDYKVGIEEVYVYGDNYDGYHYDDYNGTTKVDDMNIFHTNTTALYANYDDAVSFRFGWFLITLGSLGFILSLFRL